MPAYEFHGSINCREPYAGDVTLNSQNITSYGDFAFAQFTGMLKVQGSAAVRRIGTSAFTASGRVALIQNMVVEFVGAFPYLVEIGPNAFYKMDGKLNVQAEVLALRRIGRNAFGTRYGDVKLTVTSRCVPLEFHSNAFRYFSAPRL